MSRRTPLKEAEKRERLLAIFHETKSVFNLKELEPLANKSKGITSQSVKGILEILIADGLVEQEKIGSGMYFWSFPSKAVQQSKNRLADVKAKVAEAEEKETAMTDQLTAARQQRQPTKERKVKLEQLQALKKRKRTAEEDSKQYEHCDPDRLKKLKAACVVCKDSANRWTEACQLLAGWYRKKGVEFKDEDLFAHVGLPKDMDTLD